MMFIFFFQAEDGIRDLVRSRGLGDVYKRQILLCAIPITFAIAIIKYHLLDIDEVLNRSIVYGIVITILLVLYSAAIGVFVSSFHASDQSIVSAIAAVLLALLFQTIKTKVQNFVDKKFFRVRYNFRQELNRFTAQIKNFNDVFCLDVAKSKYISNNNFFDTLVYREVRSLNIQTINPQITNAESILRFFDGKDPNITSHQVSISENDFEIVLDSTWKNIGSVTISNLVKQKLNGIKFICGKMGAVISLAAIAPADSAENYFNEVLKNRNQLNNQMRFSDKLIDSKNIYQLYEFSCPSKKILMILETPKSTYELNKNNYDEIIKTFLIKC